MDKVKTSKKQRVTLNNESIKFVTLKAGVKTKKWDPTKELLNEAKLAVALFEALKDEDLESFKEILSAHLNAKIKTRKAKEQGLPLRTMFEALSEKGNPSLKTISKLVHLACAS